MIGKPIPPIMAGIGFTCRQKFIGLINEIVLTCQYVNSVVKLVKNVLNAKIYLFETGAAPLVVL